MFATSTLQVCMTHGIDKALSLTIRLESELHPSLKFGQRLERPEKESTAIVTKQDAASEDTSGRKTVSKASTKTTTITSRDKNTDGFPQAKRLPDKDIDKKR